MLGGRGTRLALFGLVLLLGIALVGLLLAPMSQQRLPALSSYSAAPSGTKGLRLWLEALGYRVSALEELPYRVPPHTHTVLLLAPSRSAPDDRLAELERWVAGGGTLVVAADGRRGAAVLRRFGFDLKALPVPVPRAQPATSARLDPAIREVLVDATDELVPRDSSAEALLSGEGRLLAAVASSGKGRVVASSAPALLTNRALREEGNARFALSLVGPPSNALVFDELHHGFGVSRERDLWSLLFEHAWGQAALYAALLAFVYLALRGRRFGRAQPLVISRARSLSEYVSSLAGLYRAGGKRGFIAEHFRRRLRRDLAHDLGLPGDAPDPQILARGRAVGRDPSGVLAAIAALDRGGALGDAELVGLVREAERALATVRRSAPAGAAS